MDSGFDQDESELGVLVLAVALEVLADGDGLNTETLVDATSRQSMWVGTDGMLGVLRTFLINM